MIYTTSPLCNGVVTVLLEYTDRTYGVSVRICIPLEATNDSELLAIGKVISTEAVEELPAREILVPVGKTNEVTVGYVTRFALSSLRIT